MINEHRPLVNGTRDSRLSFRSLSSCQPIIRNLTMRTAVVVCVSR